MKEKKKKVCVLVSEKAWEYLKERSEETGASLSFLVTEAIRKEYWKNKEKQETKGA